MFRNAWPMVRTLVIAGACLAPGGCNWFHLPKMLEEPSFRPETSEMSKNLRQTSKHGKKETLSPTGTALSGRGSEIEQNLGL